jgi:hypothetical protein
MTSKDILEALYKWRFPRGEKPGDVHCWFEELRVGTGYGGDRMQRFDVFELDTFPSKGNCRRVYEVKVSKSDFTKEIRYPAKRRQALLYSNEYYFAAPKGMIDPVKIPPETGLIEVDDNGKVQIVVSSPFRDSIPPNWNLVAAICRRINRLESQLTRLQVGDDDLYVLPKRDVELLRNALQELTADSNRGGWSIRQQALEMLPVIRTSIDSARLYHPAVKMSERVDEVPNEKA